MTTKAKVCLQNHPKISDLIFSCLTPRVKVCIHLKPIKPKFGVFDTQASTTGRTNNVPIALFSAASRVAFDKGTAMHFMDDRLVNLGEEVIPTLL